MTEALVVSRSKYPVQEWQGRHPPPPDFTYLIWLFLSCPRQDGQRQNEHECASAVLYG